MNFPRENKKKYNINIQHPDYIMDVFWCINDFICIISCIEWSATCSALMYIEIADEPIASFIIILQAVL